MRYSNWLAGSEQWLHQRLDRGNERLRKLSSDWAYRRGGETSLDTSFLPPTG